MAEQTSSLSSALLAANQKLLSLRAHMQALQAQRQADDAAKLPAANMPGAKLPAMPAAAPNVPAAIAALPAHLGWGSHTLTAVARRRQQGLVQSPASSWEPPPPAPMPDSLPAPAIPAPPDTLVLYPDMALAMLRQEMTAPGRLWLLLRHLDTDGRGWLHIDLVKERLTTRDAPLRICGWRQLRNLLRAGEGVFWQRDAVQRDAGRIWLRSTIKVALALGVPRLTGRAVELPLQTLTAGMGAVRAHFYASFHGGRACASERHAGSKPIARETLARLTGVSRRGQRGYEKIAGIRAQTNYAIGPRLDAETKEELAWEKGQALFTLQDYRGYQGRQRQRYLAWQLPNSYHAPHARRGRGRQKRLNRQLALARRQDALCTQRDAGNVIVATEAAATRQQRYYPGGAQAARAYNRHPQATVYWQGRGERRQRVGLWYVLGEGKER